MEWNLTFRKINGKLYYYMKTFSNFQMTWNSRGKTEENPKDKKTLLFYI